MNAHYAGTDVVFSGDGYILTECKHMGEQAISTLKLHLKVLIQNRLINNLCVRF
jgi:predicted transcriptional regulator